MEENMPDRALFYPNWSIDDPVFLFESLVYWDRLGCIVPDKNFKPWRNVWSRDGDEDMSKVLAEANECFVVPIYPTHEQKERAHEIIVRFANQRAPKNLRPEHFRSGDKAHMSSLKLLKKTVDLLSNNAWMKEAGSPNMYEVSFPVGNLVMSALAGECSSNTMPPVTDDPTEFVASCDLVLNELKITKGLIVDEDGKPADAIGEDLSFLFEAIPHITVEDGQVDCRMLKTVITARSKPDIAGLQVKFREKVEKYLKELPDAEAPERQIIRDQFKRDVEQDLGALKKDLALAGLETLTTKEGWAAIGLGALIGTAASPGVGTIAGLFGGLIGYKKTRREKLEKHWTSWLFAAKHPRFSIV
jgi:hypothetical protein